MIEKKRWNYSLGKEKWPMHEIHLEAKTYHAAARELAAKLDDGEQPEEIRQVWLLDPNHDTPRSFDVHSEIKVHYDAYENKEIEVGNEQDV